MSRRILAALSLAAAAALTLSACSAPSTSAGYVTEGKFTVGTGDPAYYPWVIGEPKDGKGFEAAVAYAVADELGFKKEDVVWVGTTFDEAIAPGPKTFDVNLQQFSITPERKENVDFSSPYYTTTQVVVTTENSKAAKATSIADLKDLLIGAQTGTTSFTEAEKIIAPTQGVKVFNSNADAKLALESGQLDAVVFDLPTAFYISGVELTGGKIVGQLPQSSDKGDQFGFVLAKGSALTSKVTAAVDKLHENGTLDKLAAEWLGGADTAPVLK